MPTIVSVSHTPISLFDGTMGRWAFRGRGPVGAESGRFEKLVVPEIVKEPEDLGGRSQIWDRDGWVIARSFVVPFAERGVFVAKGPEPSEPELKAAEEKYAEFLRSKFEEGLSQWEKYHRPELVDVHAKIAAHVFRAAAPWGTPVRSGVTVECDNCGEQISPKLAWHAACGAILDEERAVAMGHLPAIQARQARLAMEAAQEARKPEPVAAGKGR